jgi:SpoIID/LytB domain protein
MPRWSRLARGRITRLSACVLASLLACALVLGPAQAKNVRNAGLVLLDVSSDSALTVSGLGYGHGHGMSQYGAQGAAKQGLTYDQILAFYYPGTTLAKASGKIRVLISADTTSDVVVQARPRLVAREVGNVAVSWSLPELQPTATQFRIIPVGAQNEIDYYTDAWYPLATVDVDVEFFANGQPIRLVLPHGKTAAYRGSLRAATPTPGSTNRDTVNVLTLDNYIRGVVPHEMPALWQPEALAAQAVAARTYAAFERAQSRSRYYQICDTTACQVYRGADGAPTTDAAIKATAKQILKYAGRPAFTQFSASNGGWTDAGSQPYLVAEQDPYDAYPGWSFPLTADDLEKAWPQIGTATGIQVAGRDGDGAWGGRVTKLTVVGTDATVTVSGDSFRSALNMRSTLFTLTAPAPVTASAQAPSPSPSASPTP